MDEVTITVLEDAVFTIPDDMTICESEALEGITLTANSSQPGTFTWNGTEVGDELNTTLDTTTTFYVSFSNECEDYMDSVIVTVINEPDVDILSDPLVTDTTFIEGNTLTLTAIPNIPGATYEWSTGQTGQTITLQTNTIGEEIITVTITTPDGCVIEATVEVITKEIEFRIPNVFSPDGDGDNDYFNVFTNGGEPVIREFKVYSRWGQLVYDNDDPVNGWDGTFKNENAPSDVYIYSIIIDFPSGKTKNEKGDLTLLR